MGDKNQWKQMINVSAKLELSTSFTNNDAVRLFWDTAAHQWLRSRSASPSGAHGITSGPTGLIKQMQMTLLNAQQLSERTCSGATCDLYFTHCKRCHKNPEHQLLIGLFWEGRERFRSRSLLHLQLTAVIEMIWSYLFLTFSLLMTLLQF